jgi:glycyl-tRNA synthetase
VAGLYDYGPVGCSLKNNLENLWREHFILEENMFEINTSCITPANVKIDVFNIRF